MHNVRIIKSGYIYTAVCDVMNIFLYIFVIIVTNKRGYPQSKYK